MTGINKVTRFGLNNRPSTTSTASIGNTIKAVQNKVRKDKTQKNNQGLKNITENSKEVLRQKLQKWISTF